ncbi:MAG: tetratricopeptide repeat protein [Candidatus Hydrogenedentes bacterium]|nr:tetratricopeptide repeat protein [Candidatus Hydrogenedentota bacterium]
MASSTAVKALPIFVGALDETRAQELVVGRTELVARLWESVRERSVCVRGARHMGKTWALKLAAAQHPDWASPILLDAGACQTVPELVWRLAQQLGRSGIVPRDWYGRVDQWYTKLGVGDGSGKPAAPWAMVLNGTLQHASVYEGHTVPTIILDGFGAFAHRMCQAGAHDTVRRLIDAIAAFPTDWSRLRCVISGSTEMDEALCAVYGEPQRSSLHAAFATFEVPPLRHDDAQYLAACLLKGESVPCSDLLEVAEAVASTTGENPFLIHNTIDWMARFQPGMWTPDRVREVPTALWTEPTDADDTDAPDIAILSLEADDELTRAAGVLETLAQNVAIEPDAKAALHGTEKPFVAQAPAPVQIEKPKNRTTQPVEEKKNGPTHPVLNLPPAFVLFKDQPDAEPAPAPAKPAPQPRRAESSPLARMWRRVQALAQIKSYVPTTPASFYVSHADASRNDGAQQDPPSFVAFSQQETSVVGMQALADARRALLALEDSAPILGIENDESLFRRGSAHMQRAQYDAALDMFQELARRLRSGESAEIASAALLNTAYALARLRRHEESIGVADALVRQYGEDGRANVLACVAMALVNKGSSLIALGRGNEALDVCRALLACSPPDIDSIFTEAIVSAQFNLAFALAQLGKEEEAQAAYKAVAEACRTATTESMRRLAADAHYNAAVLHCKKGERFETIESCEAAVAKDPQHVRAHSLRSVSYLQLNLVGEAVGSVADGFAAFPPDTLQRATLVADVLREAMNSNGLIAMLVPALKEDAGALACGIVLWLRRLMPVDPANAPLISAAETSLRPLCERDCATLSALDAVRAARYAALGNLSALDALPEDFRGFLR